MGPDIKLELWWTYERERLLLTNNYQNGILVNESQESNNYNVLCGATEENIESDDEDEEEDDDSDCELDVSNSWLRK
jgi:hypothetical protein